MLIIIDIVPKWFIFKSEEAEWQKERQGKSAEAQRQGNS